MKLTNEQQEVRRGEKKRRRGGGEVSKTLSLLLSSSSSPPLMHAIAHQLQQAYSTHDACHWMLRVVVNWVHGRVLSQKPIDSLFK
jgi:hypothetical protein